MPQVQCSLPGRFRPRCGRIDRRIRRPGTDTENEGRRAQSDEADGYHWHRRAYSQRGQTYRKGQARVPVGETADESDRHHRSYADEQQRGPQLRIIDPGLPLKLGQDRTPGTPERAEDGEAEQRPGPA
jgi:hypothetical protein